MEKRDSWIFSIVGILLILILFGFLGSNLTGRIVSDLETGILAEDSEALDLLNEEGEKWYSGEITTSALLFAINEYLEGQGIAICGRGSISGDEECDDLNNVEGDGCSDICEIEVGWTCKNEPSVCSTICGDNLIRGDEYCDGSEVRGESCGSYGFERGTLLCTQFCDGYDTSSCNPCPSGHILNGDRVCVGNFYSDDEDAALLFVENSGSFSSARNALEATTVESSSHFLSIKNDNNGRIEVSRLSLPFDTSVISDIATIIDAELILTKRNSPSGTINRFDSDPFIRVVDVDLGENEPVANSIDYSGFGIIGGSDDIICTGNSECIDGELYEFTLNPLGLSWISLTGWTTLGVRGSSDILDSIPNWADLRIHLNSKDSNMDIPELKVTYSLPFDDCGNNDKETGEQCDGDDFGLVRGCEDIGFLNGELDCIEAGELNQCTFDIRNCRNPICGDGLTRYPEECDDGDVDSGDACSSTCEIEYCEEDVYQCLDGTIVGRDVYHNCEFFDCPGGPSEIVAWFHAREESPDNMDEIAQSGFISYVLIFNSNYDYQPESLVAEKVQIAKNNGLIPIWTRALWFADGSGSDSELAQPFVNDYATGEIFFNAEYYAWFLNRLHEEAMQYGIDLVAIDSEPYGDPNGMRTTIQGGEGEVGEAWLIRIQEAVDTAVNTPGVKRADYILPADIKNKPYDGYFGLSGLALNRIDEGTYIDCDSRLDWFLTQDIQVMGIWGVEEDECYKVEGQSCEGEFYAECPHSSGNVALWGPHTIFDNAEYWHGVNRGLMIYSSDNLGFLDKLNNYCAENAEICEQYSY